MKKPDKSNDSKMMEQGYETVPMDGDKQYFKPSWADVRLGQCDAWEVRYAEYMAEED